MKILPLNFRKDIKELNHICVQLRNRMFRWISLCVLLLTSTLTYAQEKNIENLEQAWFAYFNQTRLTDKSGIWVDIHARFTGNYFDDLGQTIGRIGYTYYLTDQTRFTVGYAYATQYGLTSGAPDIPE